MTRIILDDVLLARLRSLAREPVRRPMGHRLGGPSAQGRFIEQAQLIVELRKALREALVYIDILLLAQPKEEE